MNARRAMSRDDFRVEFEANRDNVPDEQWQGNDKKALLSNSRMTGSTVVLKCRSMSEQNRLYIIANEF